jgi:hypothetical protein
MLIRRAPRPPATARDRYDRWLKAAEAQLAAARAVDASALTTATETRRALQEELAQQPLASLSVADREHALAVARRVRQIDVRIHACGASVLAVLDGLLPDAGPSTYGRRGQLKGV